MENKIIFFNICWMSRYEGSSDLLDNAVGGGKNEHKHEVCNFLETPKGKVYGHVETSKDLTKKGLGLIDQKIQNIDKLGGKGNDFVEDVTIVWIAAKPGETGGYVVGWYKHAKVFRERQVYKKIQKCLQYPSVQHEKDGLYSYVAETNGENAYLVPPENRTLSFTKSEGRPGQAFWRVPDENNPEHRKFLNKLERFMEGVDDNQKLITDEDNSGKGSSPTATSPYTRYVNSHEARINPEHHDLQKRFIQYLKSENHTNIQEGVDCVDVRYSDPDLGHIFAEIKPCQSDQARYAIRTAMGQLFDYRQRAKKEPSLLIVIGVKPNSENEKLALENGFGIAFPRGKRFTIKWPS